MKNAMSGDYQPKGRGLLSEYGPDTAKPQAAAATNGGAVMAKTIPYSPPQGPTNINDPKSPGLHGENHGHVSGGMQMEPKQTSGRPGIGGKIYPCGSQ